MLLNNNKCSRRGFHLGARKTRKVATNTFLYKTYREILFQKVALWYLLHFVQDGSSKNALENKLFCKQCQKSKIFKNQKKRVYFPPHSYRLKAGQRPLGHYVIAGPAAAMLSPLGNHISAVDWEGGWAPLKGARGEYIRSFSPIFGFDIFAKQIFV